MTSGITTTNSAETNTLYRYALITLDDNGDWSLDSVHDSRDKADRALADAQWMLNECNARLIREHVLHLFVRRAFDYPR